MPRQIKTLSKNIELPDGNLYPANTTVTLTDAQYARLDASLYNKGILQDLGPTGSPDSASYYSVKTYGAKGDNATDDTAAIQAAITAGGNAGIPVYFPPGIYRISGSLNASAGTVLQGANSGGFGVVIAESLVSTIAAMANMNAPLILGAQGAAHVRIRDLHLDCNKNNNTSTVGISLTDVGTAEEAQWRIENCFIEAAASYGIYVGSGRRAVKIRYTDIMYCSTGVRFNGSDGEINASIVGSCTVDGIGVGAPVTRILNCDIFGNTQNGVDVFSSINQVLISGNGIDRNGANGVYLASSVSTVSIINNDFHSNSQTTNGGAHHINVQTNTIGAANIIGNVFGSDSGITNAAGYAIYMNTSTGTVNCYGNTFMASATNSGLTNSPGQIGIIAFRGTYSATSTYFQGDVVTYNGQTYICQAWNITNSAPISGATWTILGGVDNTTLPQSDAAVAVAGASVIAAPANHAHPRTVWTPNDHALVTWSYDVSFAVNTSLLSAAGAAGTLNLVRVHVPVQSTITNIITFVSTAGATLTAGQCFAALFNAAGALIAITADQSTAWTSTGIKTMALAGGPYLQAAGDYYVGLWYNGTTPPTLIRTSSIGGSGTANPINIGLASNFRYATANTGLTTAAPANLGALTASAIAWWVGLS